MRVIFLCLLLILILNLFINFFITPKLRFLVLFNLGDLSNLYIKIIVLKPDPVDQLEIRPIRGWNLAEFKKK
jgi:hypothetical protein